MKTKSKYLVLFILISFFSCDKDDDKEVQNFGIGEIRLLLNESGDNTGTFPVYNDSVYIRTGHLVDFNKKNYSNVDSAKLLIIDGHRGTCPTDFQLFDLTNNQVINQSIINVTNEHYSNYYSKDIWSNIPDTEIDLGIKLKKSCSGDFSMYGAIYLFIYLKK